MKKKVMHKPAFSLIEVIVAFSVLILVIFACTNMLVSIIRSNTENVNTLVAYGLSQEGLEAMRNIRDSNWLLGADFQGKVGTDCLWEGGCFSPLDSAKQDFVIDSRMTDISGVISGDASGIATISPWILKDVTPPGGTEIPADSIKLCKTRTGNNADVWYRPCSNSPDQNFSLFSRFIEVTPEPYGEAGVTAPDNTVKKYLVTSVVQWEEQSRKKEVRLTTQITDWKGGPL